MDKTVRMTDAAERARVIVTAVLEGRMDEARRSFNTQVLEAFTDEVRGDGLATVAGLVGEFEGFGEGSRSSAESATTPLSTFRWVTKPAT